MKQTKATIKEQEERRTLRRRFTEEVQSFRADLQAAKRYLGTKGEKITDEEEQRLFNQFELLKDYKLHYDRDSKEANTWNILSNIVDNRRSYGEDRVDKYLTEKLGEDDLFVICTLWGVNDIEILIKEARKYGFTRLFIGDNSTLSMNTLSILMELGGKVVKSFYNTEYDRFGLIVDIEQANVIDNHIIEDKEVIDDMTKALTSLGDSVYRHYGRNEVKSELLQKYAPKYGIIKAYDTLERVIEDVQASQNK